MGSESVFWSLIRQNVRGGKRREAWRQKPWRAVYFSTLFLIFVGASTYTGLKVAGPLDLRFVWLFTFGLPFAALGNAITQIVHEWKNGTVGPVTLLLSACRKSNNRLCHALFGNLFAGTATGIVTEGMVS